METSRQGRWLQVGLPAAGVATGVLLIAGPFLATVVRSVLVWDGDAIGVSIANFVALFTDPRFSSAALNTLIAGGFTTVFAMALGFTLAWLVARTDMPGRSWFETGNLVPFFLSPYEIGRAHV